VASPPRSRRSCSALGFMAAQAFWFAVSTFVLCIAVCIPFLESVKREAPAVYASWGAPSFLGLIASRRIWWPFSGMVLSRQYRQALSAYPRSRAWASWLFFAHWLQIIGLVAFVASLLSL
jgi:hypothetical protein